MTSKLAVQLEHNIQEQINYDQHSVDYNKAEDGLRKRVWGLSGEEEYLASRHIWKSEHDK